MAVNFHPNNFQDAPAAMIWFALSSVMSELPRLQCCAVSSNILAQVLTSRHGSSDSNPNKPEESRGRQLSVKEAEVSNVKAAQYAVLSALMKPDVSIDSGVVTMPCDLSDGETLEPLN